MKKILAMTLVVVMLLSLSACGGSNKYKELTDMLDNHDYEGAMEYIIALYEAHEATDPTKAAADEARAKEEQYRIAMDALANYLANKGSAMWMGYADENGEWINEEYQGNEARLKLLELFTALGDYGMAQDVVSRFYSVSDQLLEENNEYVNTFGETSDGAAWGYHYDAAGVLLEKTQWDSFERYTYDANGNVIEIRTGYGDTTNSMITYTYDEAGNLLEEEEQTSYGNHSKKVYTYDETGKIVSQENIDLTYDNSTIYNYTYNEAGQVASIRSTDEYYYNEWVYTYDEAGNVICEAYNWWGYNWETKEYEADVNSAETFVYTYENGRLISKERTQHSGVERALYTYGDYCGFNTEGLVLPDEYNSYG